MSAAAGAPAPPAPGATRRLLHLTDPHFGTERPEALAALIELGRRLAPERIVVSGDLTQRARPREFDAAGRALDALCGFADGARALVVPGNHDLPLHNLWRRMAAPYADYAARFGADLEPVVSDARWHLVGVNSTRWWRHQYGAISGGQRRRTAERLAAAPAGAWRFVAMHHPLVITGDDERLDRPFGWRRALDDWHRAGCDVILGGHIHLPFVLAWPAREPGDHRAWVVQGGTAISRRTRPGVPNSVMSFAQRPADAGEPGIERSVTQWDFDARLGEYVEAMQMRLVPRPPPPGDDVPDPD